MINALKSFVIKIFDRKIRTANMQIEETELYHPMFDKLLKNPPMTIYDTETHLIFQRHLFGDVFLFAIFKEVSVVWLALVLKESQSK